jgi:hypothetical protein
MLLDADDRRATAGAVAAGFMVAGFTDDVSSLGESS